MKIKDKRIIITGASSGIGLGLSTVLARKGAHVVLVSRREKRLIEIANKLSRTYPNAPCPLPISCDVTKTEEVINLIKNCIHQLGGIDILINNAGISVYGATEKTSLEDFHQAMAVNFFGAVHCMLEVLPIMKQQGQGLIVNIASVAAKYGVPYLGAYSASKSALVALSQTLSPEIAKSGISIMIVYPGYTSTNIFQEEKKLGGAHRPEGPYASVGKVAKAIVSAMEREKKELVLSAQGKILTMVQAFPDWLIKKKMQRIAEQLGE
ncbi:MAG: SDR family NAD(P)-dependent oxidoreductase [bacterium]